MKLLHISCSPRVQGSHSARLAQAIVERLCADGFAVGILDREAEIATALVKELAAQSHSVFFEPVDLGDHAGLAALASPARG